MLPPAAGAEGATEGIELVIPNLTRISTRRAKWWMLFVAEARYCGAVGSARLAHRLLSRQDEQVGAASEHLAALTAAAGGRSPVSAAYRRTTSVPRLLPRGGRRGGWGGAPRGHGGDSGGYGAAERASRRGRAACGEAQSGKLAEADLLRAMGASTPDSAAVRRIKTWRSPSRPLNRCRRRATRRAARRAAHRFRPSR